MTPIWKDINVNLLSTSQQEAYTIAVNGSVVYNGVCFSVGDSIIRINDVVADYFTRNKPIFSSSADSNNESASLAVEVKNSAGVVVFSDTVIADYSYLNADLSTHLPYAPVADRIDPRMPIVGTIFNTTGRTLYIDGVGQAVSTPIGSTFSRLISADARTVKMGAHEWQVVNTCDKYALYYINAFGGWEWLLLSGRASHARSYTRQEVKRKYDNSDHTARGAENWVNEEQRTLTLRTGYITDQGAKNMHHLIGSANVYLYDLETAEVSPVIITDTSYSQHSYLGNGAKPIQYTINVRVAQDFIRR